MKSTNLSELSEQELFQEGRKLKNKAWVFRVFMVFIMCTAVWSATHKGSFFYSCLPLFFMAFFIESENNYKAVQSEIQSRKSQ